jgi:hypothetical protein
MMWKKLFTIFLVKYYKLMWRSYEFMSSILQEKNILFYWYNRFNILYIVLDFIKEKKEGFY